MAALKLMIKSIETKGESIDVAIAKALAELGCERDDVSVEVLQNPKSGFLGIGREPAIVRVMFEASPASKACEFISGLLERYGTPAQVTHRENLPDKTIEVELSGGNMGSVIGRRGDTLDAIQYLAGIVVNREESDHWRVTVDTENYRAKRESTLEALAEKTAQKALKYKKPVALEPMNPHERRIIHTALQNVEGITTYSTGSEPSRKVIVAPAGAESGTGRRPAGENRAKGENRANSHSIQKNGDQRRRRRPNTNKEKQH